MEASSRDRQIAEQIAAEVRRMPGRGRTWRKVTTLLDRYGVYRLTSNVRARMMESLTQAGLEVEPSLFDVERYGTVRLKLSGGSEAAPAEQDPQPLVAAEKMVRATVWNPRREPYEVTLIEACAEASNEQSVLWLDVDQAVVEPETLQRALAIVCGVDLDTALLEDLPPTGRFSRRTATRFCPARLDGERRSGRVSSR